MDWLWDNLDRNGDGTVTLWVDLVALGWAVGSGLVTALLIAGAGFVVNRRAGK